MSIEADVRVAPPQWLDDGSGAHSNPASVPAPNTVHRFRLDIRGTSVTAYVDGVMRIAATDMTLTSGGFGVTVADSATAQFDNLIVRR